MVCPGADSSRRTPLDTDTTDQPPAEARASAGVQVWTCASLASAGCSGRNAPSPAVTPTNLLYNIVATPGGLLQYWRAGTLRGRLARTLALSTLPGVIVGAVIRVEFPPCYVRSSSWLRSPLAPARRVARDDRQSAGLRERERPSRAVTIACSSALALVVGVIGGVDGIGGG